MKQLTKKQSLLVGLTLFSMFFGAGNLIFPPYLAMQAGDNVTLAMGGFLLSAVGFPVLGIIAVAKSEGLKKLTERVHPLFALLFTVLVYLSIGPGLAIPRTASTSFEMAVAPFLMNQDWRMVAQFIYSLLFFGIAVGVALKPENLTQRLGKIMTPCLLTLIVFLFAGCVIQGVNGISETASLYQSKPFIVGFLDGYQTMDTIAALNFGIIIAMNIQKLGVKEEHAVMKETLKAGLVAGVVLSVVYVMLAYVGTISGTLHQYENGAQILSFMSNYLFGGFGQIIIGIIFFVACLNTCTGLFSSCSEYFSEQFPVLSYRKWLTVFAFTSIIFANAGLNQILSISVPVLSVIYPIAIVLIMISFVFSKKYVHVYRVSIALTALCSFIYTLSTLHISIPLISEWLTYLPFYKEGLLWIIPALVGCAIGYVIDQMKQKA